MLKVVGASWLQTRISTYILVTVVVLGLCVILFGEFGRVENDGTYSATVVWNHKGGYHIDFWGQGNDLEQLTKGAARAYYRTRIHEVGWSFLEIETISSYPDTVQAYAAGLLEGSLTWQLIHHHWNNTIGTSCKHRAHLCNKIRQTLEENSETIRSRADLLANEQPFWHMVKLFYTQLDGLEAGWRFAVRRSRKSVDILHSDFLWLAMASDIVNFGTTEEPTSSRGYPAEAGGIFIKYLLQEHPDIEPMLAIIHNTAAPYTKMLRLLKKYKFGYHVSGEKDAAEVPTRFIVTSSYPGALSSQDEYYVLSGQRDQDVLVVAGTPLKSSSNSLDDLKTEAINTQQNSESHIVMSSARIMSANWLATDGHSWSKLLARRDAPENISRPIQWIVFRSVDSSVWLVEQHPQMTHAINYTKILSDRGDLFLDGRSIFERKDKDTNDQPKLPNESSKSQIEMKKKPVQKTQHTPNSKKEIGESSHEETDKKIRKKQFNESFGKKLINDAPGLKKFTEFRGDLSESPIPFGVIDSKVALISTNGDGLRVFEATCGPSRSTDEDAFVWSESFPHLAHTGQPDKFDFPSVTPQWVWL